MVSFRVSKLEKSMDFYHSLSNGSSWSHGPVALTPNQTSDSRLATAGWNGRGLGSSALGSAGSAVRNSA